MYIFKRPVQHLGFGRSFGKGMEVPSGLYTPNQLDYLERAGYIELFSEKLEHEPETITLKQFTVKELDDMIERSGLKPFRGKKVDKIDYLKKHLMEVK